MTLTWQPAKTDPYDLIRDSAHGYPRITLELTGTDPDNCLSADASAFTEGFAERTRSALDAAPEVAEYRRLADQVRSAARTVRQLEDEADDLRAKRKELLASTPAQPSEKHLANIAASERKIADLESRIGTARAALAVLERELPPACRAVRAAAQRAAQAEHNALHASLQAKWNETLAAATAALAPHAAKLVALYRAQGATQSDAHADSVGNLLTGQVLGADVDRLADISTANDDDDNDVLPMKARAG